MEDVKKWMEAQTEEAAQLNKAQAAVRKTRSGNMRRAIQTLTGEGVAEGDEQTQKEIRKLVWKNRRQATRGFAEEMTKARKTL